jgi:ABC-type dipeptide/oligopeptide/nickel transport system ATPase component
MKELLTISNLEVVFRLHEATVQAVKGVSFSIPENKTVALVGGPSLRKSVVSQSVMRILPQTATAGRLP